jgi:hypothetical protein
MFTRCGKMRRIWATVRIEAEEAKEKECARPLRKGISGFDEENMGNSSTGLARVKTFTGNSRK